MHLKKEWATPRKWENYKNKYAKTTDFNTTYEISSPLLFKNAKISSLQLLCIPMAMIDF